VKGKYPGSETLLGGFDEGMIKKTRESASVPREGRFDGATSSLPLPVMMIWGGFAAKPGEPLSSSCLEDGAMMSGLQVPTTLE
jgi:hypothetical protein